MDANRDVILTSVFIAFEAAFSYSAFLPSIMTIATFVDSDDKVTAIRQGEVISTLLSLGVAGTVAIIYRSFLPLLAMAFASTVMVCVYEWSLRKAPALTRGSDDLAEAYEESAYYYN